MAQRQKQDSGQCWQQRGVKPIDPSATVRLHNLPGVGSGSWRQEALCSRVPGVKISAQPIPASWQGQTGVKRSEGCEAK